jgi:uncharacterized protein
VNGVCPFTVCFLCTEDSGVSLKARVNEDMKTAMRAKDVPRLGAIRLLMAAIKQREVDERKELGDGDVVAVIDKMIKQRRESVAQYVKAGRQDLADIEQREISVLGAYMPAAISETEIAAEVDAAIAECGATGMADMGRVMAVLKARIAGRADMATVSAMIKARLTA